MSDRLLLIDGMNLLFQMFYGMPARIVNRSGKAIQGTYGFVAATLKIIRKVQPTHVLVVFDGEHHNPRTEIDQDYKANRPDLADVPIEETPFSQIDDVYSALKAMGIQCYETKVVEADDLIASYTAAHSETTETVICSHDSDFYQLISDNVSILRYRGDNSTVWDVAALKERYCITGKQYVDHKSLTGDTADNIKGVPGIGPKTATKLLSSFNDLETLLSETDRIESPRIKTALEENRDRIRTNQKLIRMDCSIQLPVSYDALRCPEINELSAKTVLTQLALMP